MSGYQWQAWQVVFQNPAVPISGINYTGSIATSSAIAVEVRISVESATSGNLDVQLLGSDIQSLSESVAGLSGRRFFSKTGSVSFTVPSASVSEFNIKCHNLFDGPIGLKIETRIAEDAGSGGGTVDLTGVEANTDNVETLLQQLQLTLQSILPLIDGLELVTGNINLNATDIGLNVDGVESALAQVVTLLDPTMAPNTSLESLLAQIRNSAQNLDLLVYQSNIQLQGVEGHLTAIEGQSTDANASLTTIKAHSTAIEGYVDGIELLLGQVVGAVDGVEPALATIDSHLAGIDSQAVSTNLSLNVIRSQMTDFRTLIDGLEGQLSAISASSGNVETQLFNIDSAIGNCNSLLATEGADVMLIRPAVQALRATLELMQTDGVVNWNQLLTALNNLQVTQTTIYGAISTIDSNLAAITLQSAPLVYQAVDIVDPQSGDYTASADSGRRAVKIENNTGEANGRSAATLFLAYNGDQPDRINHVEWCKPGETIFIQCPTLEFRIAAEGVSGIRGFYSIVRYA